MKYICAASKSGHEHIFVFPRSFDHDRMHEAICGIRVDDKCGGWDREYRKPLSAGFIDESGQCYGKSETLRLSSRPDIDSAMYRLQLSGKDLFMGQEPVTPDHICSGCGSKGWKANCDQCIPY